MPNELHPGVEHLLGFFTYEHLPPKLQNVSKHFSWLAYALVGQAPVEEGSTHEQFELAGIELTVALRKLLEAKDAAVRAAL
jgi:transketolase